MKNGFYIAMCTDGPRIGQRTVLQIANETIFTLDPNNIIDYDVEGDEIRECAGCEAWKLERSIDLTEALTKDLKNTRDEIEYLRENLRSIAALLEFDIEESNPEWSEHVVGALSDRIEQIKRLDKWVKDRQDAAVSDVSALSHPGARRKIITKL